MAYTSDPNLLCAHAAQLKGERFNHDTLWERAAEVLWPDAADFITERTPGEKRTQKVYDSTPALSLARFGAAEQAMLTPRAQRWMRITIENEALSRDSDVQRWCDEVTKLLFRLRGPARFYGHAQLCYMSDGAFGNSCMFVDSDPERGLLYRATPIRELYIALDHRREVNTIYHCFKLSTVQAVDYWGDRCPERVRERLTLHPYEQHEFMRAVTPNPDYDPEGISWESMKYRSCDVYPQGKELIVEGGYHEMPYVYSRYSVGPTEVYGRGPASTVMPDIFSLQAMERTFMRSGERAVAPPLFAHDDGVLGAGQKQINLRPNAVNYGGVSPEGRLLVHPLVNNAKLDWTHEMMEQKRTNVRSAFLETLWQILIEEPGQMTATEVMQRATEKGQLLGPFIGQKQDEWLTPMIEREVAILMRAGRLPPLPDALVEAEGEYEIVYESPATRMQEMESITGAARWFEFMTPLLTLQPELIELANGEEMGRRAAKALGLDDKMLRSERELERIREIQTAAAAQASALERAGQAAEVAKTATGAAAEAAALPPEAGAQMERTLRAVA